MSRRLEFRIGRKQCMIKRINGITKIEPINLSMNGTKQTPHKSNIP